MNPDAYERTAPVVRAHLAAPTPPGVSSDHQLRSEGETSPLCYLQRGCPEESGGLTVTQQPRVFLSLILPQGSAVHMTSVGAAAPRQLTRSVWKDQTLTQGLLKCCWNIKTHAHAATHAQQFLANCRD